ncbi:unnamed protein product [Plutella xylostella]|uniref:(diamondback moth) hypothetical protein n=1 Tax=Plutella xylostella TaxID=51655 RepID=A0A8S4EJQ3_PLUXY|nr:unnamed protein product [Plutella xylostella]
MFSELWTDISPGREAGLRRHLPAVRARVEAALASSSWTQKVQLWTDISPGREAGLRRHLHAVRARVEAALASSSWTQKVQAASAIKTICRDAGGLGAQREQLVRALLAAVAGKTFDGKQHVLHALADLCE